MEPTIQNFVQNKRLAIVGASRTGKKFGNTILTELKGRGYQVYVVHPEQQEIDGEKCYSNLSALPGKVDGLVVCVSPNKAGQVLEEAAQVGIKNVWLQMGADSPDVKAQAEKLGINVVSGKCILMYADPVKGFHGFHRAFAKFFGQL
jgi:predicted CoA-binding protein